MFNLDNPIIDDSEVRRLETSSSYILPISRVILQPNQFIRHPRQYGYVLVLLDGSALLRLNTQTRVLSSGSIANIPPNTDCQVTNSTEEPAVYLLIESRPNEP